MRLRCLHIDQADWVQDAETKILELRRQSGERTRKKLIPSAYCQITEKVAGQTQVFLQAISTRKAEKKLQKVC